MFSVRNRLASLWLQQRPTDKAEHQFLSCATSTHEVGGNRHRVVVPDTDNTTIEQLVVEHAQAQGVVNRVRPLERPPAKVGRVKADHFARKAPVVAAHCTAVLVGDEHALSERRVAPTKLRSFWPLCLGPT